MRDTIGRCYEDVLTLVLLYSHTLLLILCGALLLILHLLHLRAPLLHPLLHDHLTPLLQHLLTLLGEHRAGDVGAGGEEALLGGGLVLTILQQS